MINFLMRQARMMKNDIRIRRVTVMRMIGLDLILMRGGVGEFFFGQLYDLWT